MSLSRREFLHRTSAALGASAALNMSPREGRGDASASRAGGASGGAIACSRQEAAEAARDILQQGGNAVDAIIAAFLVNCVMEPWNVGLGGYGGSMAMYHAATGRVHAIDFDSRAPRKFDPATFSEAAGRHGYLRDAAVQEDRSARREAGGKRHSVYAATGEQVWRVEEHGRGFAARVFPERRAS
jgi:hypothetical protein